jgi:hypothetical protein
MRTRLKAKGTITIKSALLCLACLSLPGLAVGCEEYAGRIGEGLRSSSP